MTKQRRQAKDSFDMSTTLTASDIFLYIFFIYLLYLLGKKNKIKSNKNVDAYTFVLVEVMKSNLI